MPDWSHLAPGEEDREARNRIERSVRDISRYDLKAIRAAEERAITLNSPDISEPKLFVLNRYLFDLPRTARRESPACQAFGGWWLGQPVTGDPASPSGSDEMDMLWPWSRSDVGTLELTGWFGGFMGPPYRALEAFDYYNRRFGRRKIESECQLVGTEISPITIWVFRSKGRWS
jgi:hypothetical protein